MYVCKERPGGIVRKRILSALLSVPFLLAGCTPVSEDTQKPQSAPVGERLEQSGLYTAAEEGDYRLTVDLDDLAVWVEDMVTGKQYRSNPANVTDDPVAGEDYQAYMRAQLEISYVYGRNLRTANSFVDCVDKEQYAVYRIENGVRVEYTIGDMSLTFEDLPEMLSAARVGELVLENPSVTEEQRDLFLACFEEQEDGRYQRRSNVFGSKQMDLIDLFSAIGYSTDDLRADAMENGFTVTAEEKVGFVIPVDYTLRDGCFRASVVTEAIVYPADCPIIKLALLPFFGAYAAGETGYTFLPDGSGIILDFAAPYDTSLDLAVYGSDRSVGKPAAPSAAQPVLMPVFGMKGEGSAFLGVIESGDAIAALHASPANKTSSYHTVYASFTVGAQDTMDLSTVTSVPTSVNVYQKTLTDTPLTVAYHFLRGEDADYSGMARIYRAYLTADRDIKTLSAELPFYLEIVGAVESNKSFLGINYNSLTPLTTYRQAADMVESLKRLQVENIYLRLSGWYGMGVSRTIPKHLKAIAALGTRKELEALTGQVPTYLDVSFFTFDTNKGISPYRDGAKMLDQQYARTWIDGEKKGYLLSPGRLPVLLDTVMDYSRKLPLAGISARDLGCAAYADYTRSAEIDRLTGASLAQAAAETLAENTAGLMLQNANMATALTADHLVTVPLGGSGYRAGGLDVPFYQMVVHGLVNYGTAPMNLSSTYTQDYLRAAEYGAGLTYQLSYTDLNTLTGVFAPQLFSVYCADWLEEAAEKQTALAEVMKGLQNQPMTHHRYITATCTETTYADGTRILINYAEKPADAGSITVPAGSFVRVDGKER